MEGGSDVKDFRDALTDLSSRIDALKHDTVTDVDQLVDRVNALTEAVEEVENKAETVVNKFKDLEAAYEAYIRDTFSVLSAIINDLEHKVEEI